jgi:N-acetylated-alpha-linked acidic dipeptidase
MRRTQLISWCRIAVVLVVSFAITHLIKPSHLAAQASSSLKIMGFSPRNAVEETKLEDRLKSMVSSDEIRKYHRYLTSHPHPAGTTHDYEVAQYIANEWTNQGLEGVTIHRYDVLGTRPVSTMLEMVAPKHFTAGLREAAYAVDPDTANAEVSSAWTGFSESGDITAPVVYAHSGNPEDYELLRKKGIDVKGKIVLVRYSNPYSYRGFKALTAEKNKVAALLIYSDPQEDGYKKGKVFPDGPWGPESHIQRGAITYDFIVPGDPLTPGWASIPGAKRIPESEARSLPHIVALPLSWQDAKPLLENMDGPLAPKNWQGGLGFKYRLTGAVKAHVKVQMDNSTEPYYDVEARIHGAEFADEWILLGNHHDAWVYGGVDPSSGGASMLELTRVLGTLLKAGHRPRRTLVFCSWDGEEVGLTGSTEWGEQFAEELRHKLVAYINVDSSTSGPNFHGDAIGSLAPMLVEASYSIQDPSGVTLHDAWLKSMAAERKKSKKGQAPEDNNLVNTRIGSGSDHTVFLNFLARPVIGLQFEGPYGVYHSMYDDFYWINHFGDPGYKYHMAMSQLWGVVASRLAQSDVLPFDFGFYGRTIDQFLDDLEKNPHFDAKKINLKDLHSLAQQFEAAGKEVWLLLDTDLESGNLPDEQLEHYNQALMSAESNWANSEGIPGRPWFKHVLYGARYTYAHLELPGITESVETGAWDKAQQQADILGRAIQSNIKLMQQIASALKTKNMPSH